MSQESKINLFTQDRVIMRAAFKKNELFFLKTVAPNKFYFPWSSYHSIFGEEICSPDRDYRITMFLANRGGGKTTFFLGGMPVHLACNLGYQNIILGSSSSETAKDFLEHPKSIIESEKFRYYFGDVRTKRWSGTRIEFKSKELGIHARITRKGADQQWEGINFNIGDKAIRWQALFLDDIETEKIAVSNTQVDRLIDWITKVVLFGRDTSPKFKAHIFITGTTYYPNAALMRLKKFKKVVKTFVFPALAMGRNKFWLIENLGDKVYEKTLTKEARALKLKEGYERKYFEKGDFGEGYYYWRNLKEGDSTWEKHPEFNKKALLKEREDFASMHRVGDWYSQRQLEPTSAGGDTFSEERIKRYSKDNLRGMNLYFFILVDAAYSDKKSADDLAMTLYAIDEEQNYYLWDYFKGRVKPEVFFEEFISMIHRNKLNNKNLQRIGVESTAYSWIETIFFEMMVREGIIVGIEELKPGKTPKPTRIRKLIHLVDMGKFYICEEHIDFLNEMLNFDASAKSMKGFNLIDASAYLIHQEGFVFAPEKSKPTKGPKSEANRQAWLDFLGDSAYEHGTYGDYTDPLGWERRRQEQGLVRRVGRNDYY
jgi:hypothetical protein